MAKLGARGREEIFRVEKETDHLSADSAKSSDVIWSRETYAMMSDKSLLRKRVVRFAPNPNLGETKPRLHDYGWKNTGKYLLKEPKEVLERFAKNGFVVVSAPGISNFDAAYYAALAATATSKL